MGARCKTVICPLFAGRNTAVKKQKTMFEDKIWLSSPTMHGEEIEYIMQAYQTNWMSTVGENINVIERLICEKVGCKYAVALSSGRRCFTLR